MIPEKKTLRRLKHKNMMLSRKNVQLMKDIGIISQHTVECDRKMDKCRADIEAKKKELDALERNLTIIEDEKHCLKEQARVKRTALNRVKLMTYWLEMAKVCVEFLVKSEQAPPAKVMVLAADLLKKSLRPGQHLAKLYGRWPDAIDVEAKIDWPAITTDWAIQCWARIENAAPIEEVKCGKIGFLRFARRWMDGNDSRRTEQTIKRVKTDWLHFCNAASATERELRKRAEGRETALFAEQIRKLNEVETAVCKKLDQMGGRLSKTTTKADLNAATRTILRGEDVDKAKPGPQMNAAKRQQIVAVEQYRKSHVWSSPHNACQKAFVKVDGGFRSPGALYAHLHAEEKRDRK